MKEIIARAFGYIMTKKAIKKYGWRLQVKFVEGWDYCCQSAIGRRVSNADWYRWKHDDGRTKPIDLDEDGRVKEA